MESKWTPPITIEAIRVFKRHAGQEVEVHVQIAGEPHYRRVFREDVVDGTLISHEILPAGIESGDLLDF